MSTAPSRQRGFTLLEVLLAITIMGLVMVGLYATLDRSLDTRDMLEREVRAARLGPDILDLLERDLERAWIANLQDDQVFVGEARTMLGESADSLAFVSAVGSTGVLRVGDGTERSLLIETGYRLRPNPDVPDVLELWRRESPHVDDEPLEDGVYERLHDRVILFELRYHEDRIQDNEPVEEWDAEERHGLPAMISVELAMEVGPRRPVEERVIGTDEGRTRWYRRLIVLDPDAQLTMRVKPYPPSFVGFADEDAGAGASGDDDGRGDEDEVEGGSEDDGGDEGGPGGNLEDILGDIFGGGGG